MSKTLTAIFDGHALLPDSPINLEPNTRYIVTIPAADQPIAKDNA